MAFGVWTASDAASVTPNDSADLAVPNACLYIGGSGDVNVDTIDGTTITFVGLYAGTILPVKVKRVRATSTTATNIVALYSNDYRQLNLQAKRAYL